MGSCLANLCRKFRTTRRGGTHREIRQNLVCQYCGVTFSVPSSRYEGHLANCRQLNDASEDQDSSIMQFEAPSKDAPYETKVTLLRGILETVRVPWIEDFKKLTVNRHQLLQYSYQQLLKFTPHDMHKEFHVHFEGEISQDAGGLTKEWLCTLTKQILSLESELFLLSQADNVSYFINPENKQDKLHLYNFSGMVFGKALFESIPIPCPLNRVLFKHLVGESITLEDLQFLDFSLYSSLNFVLNNDITGVLFEKFCVSKYELKPGGQSIAVTNENKVEYINLRINYETYDKVKDQIDSILDGFYKVVSKELLECLTFDELELALCGIPYIDVEDWEENSVYRGNYHSKHKVVKWFWEILRTFKQEQLSNLLLFCTGTSRLPVEGFRALRTTRGETAKFTIESLGLEFLYPRAHTCFNRLDIPLYDSKEDLQTSLLYVIENHCAGFGME